MNAVETDTRVLIIGYGNPLRGDDGVGWVAAEQIRDHIGEKGVSAITVHQLTPELAEVASRAELLILIDAAADRPPGQLHAEWIEPEAGGSSMAHEFSPQVLLALVEELYDKEPLARLFTVGGADFQHHEGLSPRVTHCCEKLVNEVEHVVRSWLASN